MKSRMFPFFMSKARVVSGYTDETANLTSIANTNFNAHGLCTLAELRNGQTMASSGCDTTSDAGGTLDVYFSTAKEIGKIEFWNYANTERLKHFILYRYNGGSWTKIPITSITAGGTIVNTDEGQVSNANGVTTCIFDPVTDTGFRLVFDSTWGIGDNNAYLPELKIYSVVWS